MPVNVVIPELGESITEVVLSRWHKSSGDWVDRDENLFEVESDKITTDVQAAEAGVVNLKVEEGAELEIGAIVATIDPSASKPESSGAQAEQPREAPAESKETAAASASNGSARNGGKATSVAKKIAKERGVDLSSIEGSGASGRITKSDVLAAAESTSTADAAERLKDRKPDDPQSIPRPARTSRQVSQRTPRREKMTRLRQKIAERLVHATNTAAMLTTFNECDMSAVMALRRKYKESFEKKYGIGLGFMSFFVKACASALHAFPRVNAFIDGDEIEYHDYVDMSIAVSTEKGLTVPILRDIDSLSFADIESGIKDLAIRARDGKLTMDDLTGGTFTITNGGIFGSLNSTPILNPPQSGILGMHAIKNRPIEDPANPGEIVLRPMMNLALSYDHRLVDGKEAVQFLVHVKDCIEDPQRLMLEI